LASEAKRTFPKEILLFLPEFETRTAQVVGYSLLLLFVIIATFYTVCGAWGGVVVKTLRY
jgi:hypothetical protein